MLRIIVSLLCAVSSLSYGNEFFNISSVSAKETASGHSIAVLCNDPAEGKPTYYWDRTTGQNQQLSPRCMLAQDSKDQIVITPAVAFSLVESSRGFELTGDFKQGTYHFTLGSTAKTEAGSLLKEAFQKEIVVPARKPSVSFLSSGRYLPKSEWKNLAVKHVNVSTVSVTVRNVPPENLIFWMGDDHTENATDRTSNVVLRKEFAVANKPDKPATSWLDIGSAVPAGTHGILEIRLDAKGAPGAAVRVLVTPLNLVVKRSRAPVKALSSNDELMAWAIDMTTGEPVGGVDIQVVKKSGQVVASCQTTGMAGCKVNIPASKIDPAGPFAVVAHKGEDLTYLKFDELKTNLSESQVAGLDEAQAPAYQAYLYSERGVYRPGETAHLSGLVRDRRYVAPNENMPVELRLTDARGRLARKIMPVLNEAGFFTVDIPFSNIVETGRYSVELFAAEQSIGTAHFNVEEFVPERMKVSVTSTMPHLLSGDNPSWMIDARYLFGGVPAGSDVVVACHTEPFVFAPKNNANFTYGVEDQTTKKKNKKRAPEAQVEDKKAELNAKGHVEMTCGKEVTVTSTQRLVAEASVMESGSGRASVGSAMSVVHPEKYYLGLSSGEKTANVGTPIHVKGIVVDWNGDALKNGPTEISLEWSRLEYDYGYWQDEEEGSERWQSIERYVVEQSFKVKTQSGHFEASINPQGGASGYRLRVKSGSATTELHFTSNWGWYYDDEYGEYGRTTDRTPRPAKATSLSVELPSVVSVGNALKATVKVPYAGYLLWTVENNKVLQSEWVKVSAGPVDWKFTVKDFSPSIYVSAFLVKDPHLESKQAYIPDRAFGVQHASVEPAAYRIPVKMETPTEVRSQSQLSVTLDLGKITRPTFATVAVVDEGVLSLTQYESPDPIKAIFARRALGIDTFETVGWTLLMPAQGNSNKTGGDEGLSGAGAKVQPVKPVALYQGLVPVGADGKLKLKFTLPAYRGAVRVMAVVADKQHLGSANARVIVKDPIVVQTTMPRFLAGQDELMIPVFVSNTTNAPAEVGVTISAENVPVPGLQSGIGEASPLKLLGKNSGSAKLAPGASKTLVFRAMAMRYLGAAKIRVIAQSAGVEVKDELDVPMETAAPQERLVQKLKFDGTDIDLKPFLKGWVPTTEKTSVWVTTNPYGESFSHLKYLLHYPYGCIEQTTSSARPLLYVAGLIGEIDAETVAKYSVEDLLRAGVDRVLSMQTASGGFGYWPGDTTPNYWGTAYATHFLVDAKNAGYPIPSYRLADALTWLKTEAKKQSSLQIDNDHGWLWNTTAYAHYVLALAGKGDKAEIQHHIDGLAKNPQSNMDRESLFLLKGALYLAGDRRYESDLRHPDFKYLAEARSNYFSYYSDRRSAGMMLNIMEDLKLNDGPEAESLALWVAQELGRPDWGYYNTQEIVWGVTALGKRLGKIAGDMPQVMLEANGKSVAKAPQKIASPTSSSFHVYRASEYDSFKLKLSDRPKLPVYVIVNSEGVRKNVKAVAGGQGLEIQRTFRSRDGKVLSLEKGEVKLSDVVFVELEVKNKTQGPLHNLALVDRLPASFEIENPRLGRGQLPTWAGDEQSHWAVEYMNVRDDRIELFGSIIAGGTANFVYAVRAVTAGTFSVPQSVVEPMYNPEFWARTPSQQVRVVGPWKDDVL